MQKRRLILKYLTLVFPFATIGPLFSSLLYKPVEEKSLEWPSVKISSIEEISKIRSKVFMYPLTNTPNILIKLGVSVEFGVGPERDIVAFNLLCQHLGCRVVYVPPGIPDRPTATKKFEDKHILYCPCHAGIYDVLLNAMPISGPPKCPLPRVLLKVENDRDIIAYGMTPPVIYGKGPLCSEDVSRDLIGGVLVG